MTYTPDEIVAALDLAARISGPSVSATLLWLAARVEKGREVYLTKDDSRPALLIDLSDGGKQT